MVNGVRMDKKLGQTQDNLCDEIDTDIDTLSIRSHLTAFHLLQCVALRLEAAYETAAIQTSESLRTEILLGEQQFNALFKRLFHRSALGRPYFKELIEAVCESARTTSGLTPISTLMH